MDARMFIKNILTIYEIQKTENSFWENILASCLST